MKLGKQKTLVQEMFSIETLSRIDVLCLDKTGTLTEGKMEIEQVIDLDNPFSSLKLGHHFVPLRLHVLVIDI